MSCLGHSRAFFSRAKQTASRAINQNKAIHDCLICRERIKFIEEHHKDAKNFRKVAVEINKCQVCRENLLAIIACAKMGHLYESK